MLGKYINFKAFLISFAIGVLYIYLTDDYKKVVIVYPTPSNQNKKTFIDKSNNCVKYQLNEIDCPDDESQYINVGVNY